tara:strand:+ start:71 stop:310 length:240 start_codon:yes stop_codon:yes gene_type:complete
MKTQKQFTKIWFTNNYGISLINNDFSYGLECALIHKEEENIISNNKKFNKFCNGDSVKGYMDAEDLLKVLKLVKKLKCR